MAKDINQSAIILIGLYLKLVDVSSVILIEERRVFEDKWGQL